MKPSGILALRRIILRTPAASPSTESGTSMHTVRRWFSSDEETKYRIYHEMDVSRFLEDFMQELESVKVEKNLRRLRLAAGYSQSELSRLSGVNIRNIQLYEQGVQDINKASASTLAALARPLACTIEDLME